MKIHRTVFLLGAASFFNDLSSEMIYPLLPVFLSSVLGAGTLQLGLIEGFAESTASFLKVISGIWTDRMKRRTPFIHIGYLLAGVSRCLISVARTWPLVLVLRFFDRLGKGVRTSPRDALIADVTPDHHRGRAYGFHRAMDHAGAMVGPLVAALLLSQSHLSLRQVFLCSAIPAACVMVFLLLLEKDAEALTGPLPQNTNPAPDHPLPKDFKRFLAAVFLFELGGSTDAFLLLRLADVGIPAAGIAALWSGLHFVKMLTNYSLGLLSDRMSRRHLLLGGWALYTVIYLCIGFTSVAWMTVALFLLYGFYFGLTEPTERALVGEWSGAHNRGKLFGYYHGAVGLAALPAGLIFGGLWKMWGAPTAFYFAAALSGAACIVLASANQRESRKAE